MNGCEENCKKKILIRIGLFLHPAKIKKKSEDLLSCIRAGFELEDPGDL
jgi:hypothetical protein